MGLTTPTTRSSSAVSAIQVIQAICRFRDVHTRLVWHIPGQISVGSSTLATRSVRKCSRHFRKMHPSKIRFPQENEAVRTAGLGQQECGNSNYVLVSRLQGCTLTCGIACLGACPLRCTCLLLCVSVYCARVDTQTSCKPLYHRK